MVQFDEHIFLNWIVQPPMRYKQWEFQIWKELNLVMQSIPCIDIAISGQQAINVIWPFGWGFNGSWTSISSNGCWICCLISTLYAEVRGGGTASVGCCAWYETCWGSQSVSPSIVVCESEKNDRVLIAWQLTKSQVFVMFSEFVYYIYIRTDMFYAYEHIQDVQDSCKC